MNMFLIQLVLFGLAGVLTIKLISGMGTIWAGILLIIVLVALYESTQTNK